MKHRKSVISRGKHVSAVEQLFVKIHRTESIHPLTIMFRSDPNRCAHLSSVVLSILVNSKKMTFSRGTCASVEKQLSVRNNRAEPIDRLPIVFLSDPSRPEQVPSLVLPIEPMPINLPFPCRTCVSGAPKCSFLWLRSDFKA